MYKIKLLQQIQYVAYNSEEKLLLKGGVSFSMGYGK